jgi:hypothetical protein
MKLNEIVAVTGVGGLKRIIGRRTDGLIVSDLDGSNKKFLPSRLHLFSPLDNISIYTYQDSVPLMEVFLKMKEITPPDLSVDNDALRAYMESVLPDHDQHKVHINDIKKMIKWFNILEPYGILVANTEDKKEE